MLKEQTQIPEIEQWFTSGLQIEAEGMYDWVLKSDLGEV